MDAVSKQTFTIGGSDGLELTLSGKGQRFAIKVNNYENPAPGMANLGSLLLTHIATELRERGLLTFSSSGGTLNATAELKMEEDSQHRVTLEDAVELLSGMQSRLKTLEALQAEVTPQVDNGHAKKLAEKETAVYLQAAMNVLEDYGLADGEIKGTLKEAFIDAYTQKQRG